MEYIPAPPVEAAVTCEVPLAPDDGRHLDGADGAAETIPLQDLPPVVTGATLTSPTAVVRPSPGRERPTVSIQTDRV